MNNVLERFEKEVLAYVGPRGEAIRAAASKHPAGYAIWIKAQLADTPCSAAGFDQARGKLEALGLTRGQAIKETACACPAAHVEWIDNINGKKLSRAEKIRMGWAPAAVPGRTAQGSVYYTAAVLRYRSEGLSRGNAIRRAAHDYPEAHEAWVAEYQNNRQEATPSAPHQARGDVASTPTLNPDPPARPIPQLVQTLAAPPALTAALQPAAVSRQPGARRTLNAEELAELRTRWDGSPALRAVHGDDFDLLLAHNEGRITFDEVRSLREATASKQARAMWASWDASHKRVF